MFFSQVPNISRCLFPILFFARRDNYRQLVEGLYFSIKKSFKLVRILMYVIMLWAFVGFCLFRRYGGTTHFSTYWASLYTCLHCVLSRPSVLYRLRPIFQTNNYSALYFVALTLFGDIVLTSLIIAIGTRNFRDFSIKNFKGRLRYRHTALRSLFSIYCENSVAFSTEEKSLGLVDVDQVMSLSSFQLFGRHLGLYYKMENDRYAQYLFETEDEGHTGFITERQFFRLAAAVSTRLVVTTKDTQRMMDGDKTPGTGNAE